MKKFNWIFDYMVETAFSFLPTVLSVVSKPSQIKIVGEYPKSRILWKQRPVDTCCSARERLSIVISLSNPAYCMPVCVLITYQHRDPWNDKRSLYFSTTDEGRTLEIKTLLLGKKGWGKLTKIISHREKVKPSFVHKMNGRLKAGEVNRLPG